MPMIINISDLIMNILLHLAYIEKIHTHYSFNPLYFPTSFLLSDLSPVSFLSI